MAGTDDEIVVTFEQLRAAADDCRTTASTMMSTLDTLKQQLAPVIATWDGAAQAAYVTRQTEWDTAAGDLNSLLTSIGTALDESAGIMETRERANENKFL